MMNEYFIITQTCSLQQKVLHEIAKMCWGEYVLRSTIDSEDISVPEKTRELNTHFDNVLRKLPDTLNSLPRTFSTHLPKPLIEKVKDAVIRLRQGYKDALIWEKRCECALPFTVLNPTAAGDYQAACFIDPTGHYNDWLWAKKFALDEYQDDLYRYLIACFYCFKDELTDLWPSIRLCGKDCIMEHEIYLKYGDLAGLWARKLENEYNEDDNEDFNGSSFCVSGFLDAFSEYHEHAARYFWSGCTENERAELLTDLRYDDSFYYSAKSNQTGILHFIYSLLSLEQRNTLFRDSVSSSENRLWIWACLLDSFYYESVLNEILTFPYVIPSKFYAFQLKVLALKSTESLNPIPLKIFKIMWNHLSYMQRFELLKCGFNVSFLKTIQAFDFVEFIYLSAIPQ